MKDQIIAEIKEEIDSLNNSHYTAAYNQLVKLQYKEDSTLTIDKATYDSLMLFHNHQDGFPNGLYKGAENNDISVYIKELIRAIKGVIRRFCDGEYQQTAIVLKAAESVSMHTLIEIVCHETNIDGLFVRIYFHTVYEYFKHVSIKSICKVIN